MTFFWRGKGRDNHCFKDYTAAGGAYGCSRVFRASGALDLLVFAVRPAADFLRIPTEALPMVFLRPISGSASLAMLSDIFKMYGPDSL